MAIANDSNAQELAAPSHAPARPSFREALRFWLKLGLISFGGPTGQIAIMHSELVEKRRWVSNARFLHALNFCMLLPGPEATQLAIYIGWLLHRTRGGITAGMLFVLPSALILWVLSYLYVMYGNTMFVSAIFHGLNPAVVAIVAAAAIRIGRKALGNEVAWAVAGLAFVGLFFFHVPFPIVIVAAALIGWMGGRRWPKRFLSAPSAGTENEGLAIVRGEGTRLDHADLSFARAVRVVAVALTLWWTPVFLLMLWLGREHVLIQEGIFFSKAALITFGGAYAVLPYVAQQAVANYGWLDAEQMLDGLGLAETTPGPLIMVLQFVGFLGGWTKAGSLPPLAAATLGAFVAIWTTFVPCFLWIFLGAPYIERWRGRATLTSTLSTVTAAVVGVILNLAVWFALHAFFPSPGAIDWFAVGIAAVSFVGIVKWKWEIIPVIVGAGTGGWLWHLMRS